MVFFPVVRRCHLLRICVVNVFRVVQSHGSAVAKPPEEDDEARGIGDYLTEGCGDE